MHEQLQQQLSAAQETIQALTKRMRQLEGRHSQSPFQKQLQSYQQRIAEKTAALEKARIWSELIVKGSMDAIVRVDQSGAVQSWNPMAEEIFGYKESDILGRLIEDTLLPKRLHNTHLKNFHRHLKRGRGALMNLRIEGIAQCKDGSEIPVEFIGSAVKQGDILAYIMVLRDISERKAAEKALRDSHASLEVLVEERTAKVRDLAAIIEVSLNLIGMADQQGNVIYINPAGRKILGLSKDASLDGSKIERFHSPETNKNLTEDILPQAIKHGAIETECEFLDQDSKPVPMACTFMALPDLHGNPVHMVVVARDLRNEIALQKQVEHVDRLESLGVLAGGIAHDFNNILTAIIGNAELAVRKIDAYSPVKNHLDSIKQSGLQAANLCKQMLAYSGKGSFIIQQLDLSRLVREIVALLEVSIDKKVSLKLDLCKPLPSIDGDITQIQQIIMNLVINASEAMNKAGGTITITTGLMQVDEAYLKKSLHKVGSSVGNFVYMKVSDSGCGMDTETQKKIFDPFFTTKFTGRGLGMSAVLGIVNGHKGILNLHSEPDIGTTFKIAFPVSSVSNAVSIEQKDEKVLKHCAGKILVIDDEESIRKLACILLEDMGYSVVTAVDGQDGLEVFQKHQKDLTGVILDMTMPRMNGEDCFQALQKISPNVQVILSSGYSEEDATDHFQDKGLAGFIQKPYKIAHFQKVVAESFGL
ncbi:PAS domain S-box protein [Mariprofundus ferrooxydans]|nr:PAS domain S-box protein [Mariprofundus ferrooxydans]